MSESFAEQLERVQLMASGDHKWDLSDNDMAALRALLDEVEKLRVQRDERTKLLHRIWQAYKTGYPICDSEEGLATYRADLERLAAGEQQP